MPNYTAAGLKISGKRWYGVMNPNLKFALFMYTEVQEREIYISVYSHLYIMVEAPS